MPLLLLLLLLFGVSLIILVRFIGLQIRDVAIGKSGLGMLLSHEFEPSSCSLVAAFRYVSLLRIVNFVPHLASCGLFFVVLHVYGEFL